MLTEDNKKELEKLVEEIERKTNNYMIIPFIDKGKYKDKLLESTYLEEQIERLFDELEIDKITIKYPIVITTSKLEKNNRYFFYLINYISNRWEEVFVYKVIKRNKVWTKPILDSEEIDLIQSKIKNYLYKNGETYIINWWYNIKNETIYQMSAEKIVHFGIYWWTWSWKTQRTLYLLQQYANLWPSEFIIVDKNWFDYKDFVLNYKDRIRFYSNLEEIDTEEKIILFIMFLYLNLAERQNSLKKIGVKEFKDIFKLENYEEILERIPRKFIVLDEFESFRNSINKDLREKFDNILAHLIKVSRSYWWTIIISTQTFNVDAVPSTIRKNLNHQIGFLQGVSRYKKDLWISWNEDEILLEAKTFIFYDSATNSLYTAPPANISEIEIDEENEKFLNNKKELARMVLEFLSNIKLESIDEDIYDYFDLDKDSFKDSENYLLITFYLNILKETIENFVKSLLVLGDGLDFRTFQLEKIKYKNNLDNIIGDFLFDFIKQYSLFWKMKKNLLTKFNPAETKPYFDDDNVNELADKIEEFLKQNVRLYIDDLK